MIIRERVYEARIVSKLLYNPGLAREFGLEIISKKDTSENTHIDNRIVSTEITSSTDHCE